MCTQEMKEHRNRQRTGLFFDTEATTALLTAEMSFKRSLTGRQQASLCIP